MTDTIGRLPLRHAEERATELSRALEDLPRLNHCDDDSPGSPRWRHQSLSKGAAGVAILHAARAQTNPEHGDRVLPWLHRAVSDDLSVGPGAGLWFGAPAIAFTIAVSSPHRYRRASTQLDTAVTRLVQARLDAAHARLAAATRPALSEFDLVRGLTGLGAHLLLRDPDGDLIRSVLGYLVRLTDPVPAHDEAGTDVPGWWTNDAPSGRLEVRSGHADLGMAHGISGPLAFLALAMRRGVTVAGHAAAIDRICHWLDSWRQDAPAGAWWPERVTLADVHAEHPAQAGPARPSWCYGTPGLARAQQLAAVARHDPTRQIRAEQALARCIADPTQLARLRDPYLCHGWAGLVATTWYAIADADTPQLDGLLPRLLQELIDNTHVMPPHRPYGLIEGRAGVALTLHTIATATPGGWPTCLLIN